MRCTFFGHSNTLDDIQPKLENTIIDLIKNYGVDIFYVCNHGNFDFIVKNTLNKVKTHYPNISYYVVVAYEHYKNIDMTCNILYPLELKNTHPRYAIPKRNTWMIDKSDIVISYVINSFGGAYRFTKLANDKGKHIINLTE